MQIHKGLDNITIQNAVVTIGSFDGVHRGHQTVLRGLLRCAERQRGESVLLTFDPHPREVLYPNETMEILTTFEEKVSLLTQVGVEHLVVLPFTHELALLPYRDFVEQILVKKIGMKTLIVGYDHHFGKNREGDFDSLKLLGQEIGFEVFKQDVLSAHDVNISSTKIRKALHEGNMELVREFLGYDYLISGKIEHGDALGRTIGFPTANIAPDSPHKLLPADGVYGVLTEINGQTYQGMLYIGTRPSLHAEKQRRVEVHLFDFNENIYGAYVILHVLFCTRGEKTFSSIRELSAQLCQDKQEVLKKMDK